MQAIGTARVASLSTLLLAVLLFLFVTAPPAHAAWVAADARIADPNHTGYVGLLNVRVVNAAKNDSAAVTEVQCSDDGEDWYRMQYTGEALDWVLYGESGAKTLYVRFAASDGTLSPVVEATTVVDTEAPRTRALRPARGSSRSARFDFALTDSVSPRVKATLMIRGGGVTRTVALGWMKTGTHRATVRLHLPVGRYHWTVRAMDLARWAQAGATTQSLVVR